MKTLALILAIVLSGCTSVPISQADREQFAAKATLRDMQASQSLQRASQSNNYR